MHIVKGIAIVVLLVGVCDSTWSCECTVGSPIEQMKAYDHVFSGTVIQNVRSTHEDSVLSMTFPLVTSTLHIQDTWRGTYTGDAVDLIQVDGSCLRDLRIGDSYLVFARSTELGLVTSLCSPTLLFSQAAEHLEFLGEPRSH